jgi:Zn-dependent M32 family carboxypeptidase
VDGRGITCVRCAGGDIVERKVMSSAVEQVMGEIERHYKDTQRRANTLVMNPQFLRQLKEAKVVWRYQHADLDFPVFKMQLQDGTEIALGLPVRIDRNEPSVRACIEVRKPCG